MQILSAFKESSSCILLYVKIASNNKENKILGEVIKNNQQYIKIAIKALKINNQANDMLIQYLSDILNTLQKNIHIKIGKTSSYKILEIYNINLQKIQKVFLRC